MAAPEFLEPWQIEYLDRCFKKGDGMRKHWRILREDYIEGDDITAAVECYNFIQQCADTLPSVHDIGYHKGDCPPCRLLDRLAKHKLPVQR